MRKSPGPKHTHKNSWSHHASPLSKATPTISPVRSKIVKAHYDRSTPTDLTPNRGDRSANKADAPPFNPIDYVIPGLTETDVEQLKEVFDSYDLDKNELITPMELRNALVNYGYNASKETVYGIIAEYDQEERGGLIFPEFLKLMVRGPPGNYETKEEIRKVFKLFDKNDKGYLDINDLKVAAKELKEEIDEETLDQMVSKMGTDADKKITFTDFYNVMIRKIDV